MAFNKMAIAMAIVATGTIGAAAMASGDAQVAAPAAAALAPPPGPGLDLINERCGFCHTTVQAFGVRKTPADWAVVVQSMIDRGAELTPEEQKIVTEYLATNRAIARSGAAAAVAPATTVPGAH